MTALVPLKAPIWLWAGVVATLAAGAVTAAVELSGGSGGPTVPRVSVLGEQFTRPGNGNGNGGVGNGNGKGNISNPGHPITVTGTAPTGLAPGVTKPVNVTVTNPNNQPVKVLSVSIQVGDAGGCVASRNVTTTSYDATAPGATAYVAPANGRVTVPLTITMRNLASNQDACQGVTFPLTFTVTAGQT